MQPDALSALTEEEIIHRLRAAADLGIEPNSARYSQFRPAAVLVPLLWQHEQWHLVLTRRTEHVNSHKGQVSFPGGAAEAGDDSPEATALRETYEEIGLLPNSVQILGRLPVRPTISSFLVTPVVARIHEPVSFQLSIAEVSRVFTIPLRWLADPLNREEKPRTVPGGLYERIIYFRAYDGEVLWGASARITVDLLNVLQIPLE